MRTTDESGIRAALIAYQEALTDVNIFDLRTVVQNILSAKPLRKWSPSAPELVQMCRDEKARRENPPSVPQIEPPDILPGDDEYARMKAKADKLVAELVAATDVKKTISLAQMLARRQPADGDYGWAERQKKRDDG